MEIQPTDFENAAFTAFMVGLWFSLESRKEREVLVSRAILVFNLDLLLHLGKVPRPVLRLVPLSTVDENMDRAHRLDAVRTR